MESRIISTVEDDNPAIDIDEITVSLVPGDDLTFDITLQVPTATSAPLDIFLLQDLSGSFNDDLNNLQTLIPSVVDEVTGLQPDTLFGLGSFVDYPEEGLAADDYPYRLDLPLTDDAESFQAAVDDLETAFGGDEPESQLTALLSTAEDFDEIGFREESSKIVLLSTDAPFWSSDDPFFSEDGDPLYPSVEEVSTAFSDNGLVPIFLLAPNPAIPDYEDRYEEIAEPLGGTVVPLESDSENLVTAISSGLETVLDNIVISETSDDFDIVDFQPTVFTDVTSGEQQTFQVTLSAGETAQSDTIELQIPGYGTTTINVEIPSGSGVIRGTKWDDLDADGIRDSEIVIQGDEPDVIFAIDVSGSSDFDFVGSPVGDVNNDGLENTRLDAELAGFIALNNQLIEQGFEDDAEVGIVVFSGNAAQADMNLSEDGFQFTTTPSADADANGINDVEDILRSIESGAFGVGNDTGTNFEVALDAVEDTFVEIGTEPGDGNLIFLSDGEVNRAEGEFGDEVDSLRNNIEANLYAFGVGEDASLPDLQIIDPNARVFTTSDELLDVFSNLEDTDGTGDEQNFTEPAVEGVSIYIDTNENAVFDDGEPLSVTDADGNYEFTDLAAGTYIVREILPDGTTQTAPATGFHTVELADGEVVEGLDFGNTTASAETVGIIRGTKWDDLDGDGVRDSEIVIQGDEPDVIFTIDISGSSTNPFVGSPVGDVNNDGLADTRLDAELAGFISLNNQLIEQGFGDSSEVSIVVFASESAKADMNLVEDGLQLSIAPNADENGNGISDVEEILRSVQIDAFDVGDQTNFEAALQEAEDTFLALGTESGDGNLVFLSDGEVNLREDSFEDNAERLSSDLGANLYAFGVGEDASLSDLQIIDPNARVFTTSDELLDIFSNLESGSGTGGEQNFTEPGIEGVTIYIDANENGVFDESERSTVTDADGSYEFSDLAPGTYSIREVLPDETAQTFPGEDAGGSHTVEITADNAVVEGLDFGNVLISGDAPEDDDYEENDVLSSAFDLSANPQTWLTDISGFGISADEDWYAVEVAPGANTLSVDLTFTHESADLDLAVYDADGNVIGSSVSVTDNESLEIVVPESGDYFLQVYSFGDYVNNPYDLRWESSPLDDAYEENDQITNPYDLTPYQDTWLSDIEGVGIANDSDWYSFTTTTENEQLVADLQFVHSQVDLNLALYDSSGNFLASAGSSTDNERIEAPLEDAETYFLEVFEVGDAGIGSPYDLRWSI